MCSCILLYFGKPSETFYAFLDKITKLVNCEVQSRLKIVFIHIYLHCLIAGFSINVWVFERYLKVRTIILKKLLFSLLFKFLNIHRYNILTFNTYEFASNYIGTDFKLYFSIGIVRNISC